MVTRSAVTRIELVAAISIVRFCRLTWTVCAEALVRQPIARMANATNKFLFTRAPPRCPHALAWRKSLQRYLRSALCNRGCIETQQESDGQLVLGELETVEVA